MFRAASTWQYLVASDLVERELGGKRTGFAGYHLIGEARDMASDRRWRTVKLHDRDPYWGEILRRDEARGLYCYRDIRDVAFSLMHKWAVSFEYLIDSRTLARIVKNDRFWKEQPNVLVQRYESVVSDYAAAAAGIAAHIGLALTPAAAARLGSDYGLEKNTARCVDFAADLQRAGVELSDPKNVQLKDAETELHWNHIRSGAVGDWRVRATAEQARALDQAFGDWLKENGYVVGE